jgi:hypothetical protein
MNSIPQTVLSLVEGLSDFAKWEEEVLRLSQEIAQEIASMALRAIDEELMNEREKSLRLIGTRERTITTRFGPLTIERRLYRDKQGEYHFLLDEALGLESRQSCTPSLEHLSNLISSYVPFRVASHIISRFISEAPAHATIHAMVQRTGREKKADEREKARALFEDGELPTSKMRKTDRLIIEADGVVVSLQREKKRRKEMKLAFSYEGWEPCSRDRYRTVEKTVHSGFAPTGAFWQGFSVSLAERYDLSSIADVVLGGDGASWVRGGNKLFPKSTYQLDRFHLNRALKRALDGAQAARAYQKACDGDLNGADTILARSQEVAPEEKAETIEETRRYLASNSDGLPDWRRERGEEGLRGLGAAEGNIDKILANRFKKRGMSWTVSGGDHMAKVIQMRDNGALEDWVHWRHTHDRGLASLSVASERLKQDMGKDLGAWLESHMPALEGPHSTRPWVTMLRELAHLPRVV